MQHHYIHSTSNMSCSTCSIDNCILISIHHWNTCLTCNPPSAPSHSIEFSGMCVLQACSEDTATLFASASCLLLKLTFVSLTSLIRYGGGLLQPTNILNNRTLVFHSPFFCLLISQIMEENLLREHSRNIHFNHCHWDYFSPIRIKLTFISLIGLIYWNCLCLYLRTRNLLNNRLIFFLKTSSWHFWEKKISFPRSQISRVFLLSK